MKKETIRKIKCALMLAVSATIGLIGINHGMDEAFADEGDTRLSSEIIEICEEIGEEYYICPELLEAIIESESNGDIHAISSSGAVGLMQLKPEYTAYTMEELFDPYTNIAAGASVIMEYASEWDDLYVVLTAYRYGPYSNELKRAESSDFWCSYAKRIVRRSEQLERMHDK